MFLILLKKTTNLEGPKSPLTLVIEEETGAVRLTKIPDSDTMYGQYWYRSGINTTMTEELGDIVKILF